MKRPRFNSLLADFLILVGLAGIFHGLHIHRPWLAFVVVGSLVLLLGVSGARSAAADNRGAAE